MGNHDELSCVTNDLQQMFVWLSKLCLTERPRDVQRFCLDKLSQKLGMRLSTEHAPGLSREVSLLENDNATEFVRDVRLARHESPQRKEETQSRECGYVSSEESDSGVGLSTTSGFDKSVTDVDDETDGSDDGMERAGERGTSRANGKDRNPEFFNRNVFSEAELEAMVEQYVKDDRMKSLFQAWDGDNSGAIDFVELVIALHKFEDVARAGVDIKVAADALVEFVESDTERELKLPQFAKVIIVFARNNFGKSFDEVADHMLKVATSTSEAAVLHAARGRDVSEIMAFDKEELELMRETAQCVSLNVESNISKLRTTRGVANQMNKRGKPICNTK